jgi:hypothetical protein
VFAFEWKDPHTGRKTQMTWTRLLQGFKNSPTLFGEALAVDLSTFPEENLSCTLLQYVDDLLLVSHNQEKCWVGTKALLAQCSEAGYKVSWKKAQLCQQEVRYLGFIISEGQCTLGLERKQVVFSISQLKTKKEVQEFPGAAGFCCIWIPGYSSLAKPLYEAIAGSRKDSVNWAPDQEKAFQEIKRLLTCTPALGLPDVK